MSILIGSDSKIIVQGLTGSEGTKHATRMLASGAQVVGGVNPRKAGTTVEIGGSTLPIFGTVAEAMAETGADTSVVFVPPAFAKGAVVEAIEAGIPLCVVITEGIPVKDSAEFWALAKSKGGATRIIGPNCPGVISPGRCNIGITAGEIAMGGGPVGIVSRSGTLTYQALHEMTQRGIGQTTCVGIGGDPVPGTSFIDALEAFEADPETGGVIMIGEIGGSAEEEAAEFMKRQMKKPVVAYIAGLTAPPGKKMGHAGAIISGSKGTAAAKIEALEGAGCLIAQNPTEIGSIMAEVVAKL
jgi:succinyl-CoA synthetase alpha subunit